MNVFVIGVTGNTGRRVACALLRRGDTVSGLYRKPEQADSLLKLGVRGTLGDIATISDQELACAMDGAEAVVYTAGAGDQDSEAMIDAVDDRGCAKAAAAAKLSGICQFLLISVFPEAGRNEAWGASFEHYIAAKKRAEVKLVRENLDWLILRPSSLTDDPAQGQISLSAAEAHTTLSRGDLAETIADLLHVPELRRRILELTQGKNSVAEAIDQLLL